jgi:hypothetical protein
MALVIRIGWLWLQRWSMQWWLACYPLKRMALCPIINNGPVMTL